MVMLFVKSPVVKFWIIRPWINPVKIIENNLVVFAEAFGIELNFPTKNGRRCNERGRIWFGC